MNLYKPGRGSSSIVIMFDYHYVEIAIDSKIWFILNDTPLLFLIYLQYLMFITPLNHMDQINQIYLL